MAQREALNGPAAAALEKRVVELLLFQNNSSPNPFQHYR